MSVINQKTMGLLVLAFLAGAFIASSELRAFAANTVGSIDIIDGAIQSIDIGNGQVKAADLGANSVTAIKILDGEVKAADIAADAVGASELQGVNKLLFGQCVLGDTDKAKEVSSGGILVIICNISGVDSDDTAVATLGHVSFSCFTLAKAIPDTNRVILHITNYCSNPQNIGSTTAPIGIIVFDK
jgi:hypothetical protein